MRGENARARQRSRSTSDPERLSALLDLIAHAPTPHELLRALVHDPVHTPAPRAGAIGMIADDAELVELASYGLTRPHGFIERQSVWQEIPPFIDFRTVSPVRRSVTELRAAVRSAGIHLEPEDWAQSVMIQSVHARRSTPVGALMLLFDADMDVPVVASLHGGDLHAALLIAFRSEPFRAALREVDARIHGTGPLLTDRELACLRQVARGRSNKEIAADIRMSPSTVKSALSSVFTKLEVTRRSQAVYAARHLGLI